MHHIEQEAPEHVADRVGPGWCAAQQEARRAGPFCIVQAGQALAQLAGGVVPRGHDRLRAAGMRPRLPTDLAMVEQIAHRALLFGQLPRQVSRARRALARAVSPFVSGDGAQHLSERSLLGLPPLDKEIGDVHDNPPPTKCTRSVPRVAGSTLRGYPTVADSRRAAKRSEGWSP